MSHSIEKIHLNQTLTIGGGPAQLAVAVGGNMTCPPSGHHDQALIGVGEKGGAESIRYTIFKDRFAHKKKEICSAWGDLTVYLTRPTSYRSKDAMPLLKLATFGDLRSERNSLRHDKNLQRVTGIEGDYDGETIPIEEAKRRLEDRGIRGLLYTSASHKPSKPRWRVLAPLSREHVPEERKALIADLNQALGGVLAKESFTLSQAFYFGRIEGSQYQCCLTFDDPEGGNFIDLVHERGSSLRSPGRLPNSGVISLAGPVPQYLLADAKVMSLGRLLKTGDGRREFLKSYIASKSARGFEAWEVRTLVDAYVGKYFDPSDPPDEADIDQIVDWAASREAGRHTLIPSTSAPWSFTNAPPEAKAEKRVFRFDPAEGIVNVPTNYPPPRDYVFAETVTQGTVCAIAGSGGSSKTMLLIQACVAAAAGAKVGGLKVAEGASLLYLGEEDAAERDRRIGGICDHFKVNRGLVHQRMRCFPAAGRDIRLTQTTFGASPEETSLSDEIVAHASSLSDECGVPVTMIVIDHARLAMAGDPNDAEDVTQLTRVLTSIAQRTGAAIFLLAHSPKSVINKPGSEINVADIAGSSAFADNARSAFMLYAMRDGEAKEFDLQGVDRSRFICLRNVKANYAASGSSYWFKRVSLPNWGVAVLEDVMLFPARGGPSKTKAALRQRILDMLNSKPGGLSLRALRDKAGVAGPLQASEKAVRAEIDAMLEDGQVVQREPTDDERRVHRLGGQVREVLVAADPCGAG